MASLTDESNDMPSATTSTSPTITLDQLPNDVLLSIWANLDDPVPFSLVNKRFQTLSKDALWRAKWLMQRYERYLVIFEAIARPKLFTPSLLDRLIRLGAPLSVNLIQLIQLTWNPTVRDLMYEMDTSIRWGRISLAAYVALMQHASNMYSENISFERKDCQCSIFEDERLLMQQEVATTTSDRLRRLFEVEGFMPLPLTARDDTQHGFRVRRSQPEAFAFIVQDPALASIVYGKGYILTTERTESIINEWYEMFGGETNDLVETLKVDGIVNVSESFAKPIVERRHCHCNKALCAVKFDRRRVLCSLMVRLNESSALPFRLQDIVENYADHLPASHHKHDQPAN